MSEKVYTIIVYESQLGRLIQFAEKDWKETGNGELLACLQEQKEMAEAPGNQ